MHTRSPKQLVARKRDVHLAERRPDRCEKSTDVALEEMSDITDAEAIGARHFAGVDHESLVAQPCVEFFELKVRMIRAAESGDDRALQFGDLVCTGQTRLEIVFGRL